MLYVCVRGVMGRCVFCLYCAALSCRCSSMGCMSVSSCICFVCVLCDVVRMCDFPLM